MQATVSDYQFLSLDDAKAYTLAGNATITLQSLKTGAHFTYKVRQAKGKLSDDPAQLWFVSLLSGQDNQSDYQYLGIIRDGRFTRTAKSRIGETASSFMAFSWFWNGKGLHLTILRPNTCGRCGRTLTHPDSVISGIGPECQTKIGSAL
jgi:Family of unknown function (DUF6011)